MGAAIPAIVSCIIFKMYRWHDKAIEKWVFFLVSFLPFTLLGEQNWRISCIDCVSVALWINWFNLRGSMHVSDIDAKRYFNLSIYAIFYKRRDVESAPKRFIRNFLCG